MPPTKRDGKQARKFRYFLVQLGWTILYRCATSSGNGSLGSKHQNTNESSKARIPRPKPCLYLRIATYITDLKMDRCASVGAHPRAIRMSESAARSTSSGGGNGSRVATTWDRTPGRFTPSQAEGVTSIPFSVPRSVCSNPPTRSPRRCSIKEETPIMRDAIQSCAASRKLVVRTKARPPRFAISFRPVAA